MLMLQKSYTEGLRALVLYTAAQQDAVQVATLSGRVDAAAAARNDLRLPGTKGAGSGRGEGGLTLWRRPPVEKSYREGLRALVLYTAAQQDAVQVATLSGRVDAAAAARNDLLLPVIKGVGSERAYEMLTLSLQTLGGSGFLQDYPMEQYVRDAKIDSLYEGTTAIQGMDLYFRKIVRNQGKALGFLLGQIN